MTTMKSQNISTTVMKTLDSSILKRLILGFSIRKGAEVGEKSATPKSLIRHRKESPQQFYHTMQVKFTKKKKTVINKVNFIFQDKGGDFIK